MNNHIARGSCRKCSAARPGSAPIPTREEYDEYEKHTSKKKGGKKRKWKDNGWKTAAEQRGGGEPERDPSADAPSKKRRRRQESVGIAAEAAYGRRAGSRRAHGEVGSR